MLHIGRNVISMLISRILAAVILFLIYTHLVQYLGPAQAGQFGLLASYLTVFSFFVDLGMSQLVIKKISEDREHASKYLNNYFTTQFLLALGFMVIMDAFVFFADYPQVVKNALYITALSLLVSAMSLPFRSVVTAFQRLTVMAKINFVNSLINATIMLLAIIFRQNVFFLAFISLTVAIFDLIFYYFYVNKQFAPFKFEFDISFVKQLFVWTWPFTLLTLFSIYNRVDGLLLPHLRNFTETGYYSAAYKIWDTLAFLPAIIGVSLYPFFAEAMSKNQIENVKKGLEVYTRYMIALAIPIAVGAFILADPITLTLFGREFAPAAPAVWLLVLASCVLFVYSPVNSLIISQRTKIATRVTGFTLLFNISANLIFIPKFGFVAAAAVTAASELIQTIAYTYVVKKQLVNFTYFANFVKPAIAAASMAAVLYFSPIKSLWVEVLLGGLVYAIVLLILRFFHREDWELLKAALNVRKNVYPAPPASTTVDK